MRDIHDDRLFIANISALNVGETLNHGRDTNFR